MSPFLFPLAVYFSASICVIVLLYLYRKKSDRDFEWADVLMVFLFGPIAIFIILVIDLLFPPSSDPFQLIYAKLSFYKGKTSGKILDEIRADNQTVGGWRMERMRTESLLELMVMQGFARLKQVTLAEIEGDQASESEVEFGEEVGVVDTEPGVSVAADKDSEAQNFDAETIKLYYRGNPPTKRRKWRWQFSSLLNPIPNQ